MIEDECPLLHKCIKYRTSDSGLNKLKQMIDAWESNKKSIDFVSKIGRLVRKIRISNGQSN